MSIYGSGFDQMQWFTVGAYSLEVKARQTVTEAKRLRDERLQTQIRQAIKITLDAEEKQ